MGQTIEEIYRTTLLETEITIASVKGTYRFELSEEDLNIRPLVQLDDIYAQLIIDKYSGTLSSIRFLTKIHLSNNVHMNCIIVVSFKRQSPQTKRCGRKSKEVAQIKSLIFQM
ncbi:CAP-associated domain-containing protein [Bacillus sp. N9]